MIESLCSPENLQRVGFLAVVPHLLRQFDVEPAGLLTSVGLNADALDDPNAAIPFSVACQLLHSAAEQTKCPHFGLEVAQTIGTASLGLVGELMRNAPTLGMALQDFVSHQHRNAHGGAAYLLAIEDLAFFGYAVYQRNLTGLHQICDAAAMAAFNLVRQLAVQGPGQGTAPVLEVRFARTEPLHVAHYDRAFGVTLLFNQSQTAVVLQRKCLDLSVPKADPERREQLKEQVKHVWHAGALDSVTQLRRLLRVALLSGETAVEDVSSQMGMSRRTLHRRLSEAGLAFSQVLEETRCDFAKQLLAGTHLSSAEIGMAVGYGDPSTFSRMFKRTQGIPPNKWRSTMRLPKNSGQASARIQQPVTSL